MKLPSRPRIYCEATNWVAQEMFTLSEYCFLIDRNKPTKGMDRLKFEDIRDSEFLPPDLRFNKDIYE